MPPVPEPDVRGCSSAPRMAAATAAFQRIVTSVEQCTQEVPNRLTWHIGRTTANRRCQTAFFRRQASIRRRRTTSGGWRMTGNGGWTARRVACCCTACRHGPVRGYRLVGCHRFVRRGRLVHGHWLIRCHRSIPCDGLIGPSRFIRRDGLVSCHRLVCHRWRRIFRCRDFAADASILLSMRDPAGDNDHHHCSQQHQHSPEQISLSAIETTRKPSGREKSCEHGPPSLR